MIKKTFLIIFFLFQITNSNAQTLGTINYEEIFKNSNAFKNFLKEINKYKEKQLKDIKKIEDKLLKEKKKLDDSQLILSTEEFNNRLLIYNDQVRDYETKVNQINNEIYNNIEEGKSLIANEVTKILQTIALEKNIEIIFDENNYVLASKNIDLTKDIVKIINKNIKKINFNK